MNTPARTARFRALLIVMALVLAASWPCARAADRMAICLNWTPGADHAAFYLARERGWFAEARLAAELLPGAGSPDALAKLGRGECDAAVADFTALLSARRKGQDPVAVMAIVSDSPLSFFAVAPRVLSTLADVEGSRIASDEKEPGRRLWPRLARLGAVDPSGVRWVQTSNNAKVEALRQGSADLAMSSFYHHELEFRAAFGSRLVTLRWRDIGVNPYGNVLAVSARTIATRPELVRRLVAVAQRAHVACVDAPDPCLDALLAASPYLDAAGEGAKWGLIRPLIAPSRLRGSTFGWLDPEQAADNLSGIGGREAPSDLRASMDDRFLDPSVRSP
ncbi:MAG: hypothetical protein GC151_05650 [Betaproteobacteria bacterium]|nr:hypothetical protein [Betaproteobacteria bacterium]